MVQIKRLILSLDEIIASLVLAFITLLTVAGVFCRYVLNRPIAWQEEVSMVAMVWLVFMGCSVVAKRSAHIPIDTLTRLLPEKYRHLWLCCVNGLIVLVLGLMFWHATKLTLQTQKLTTILKIPYQFVYGVAPLSTLLMIGHILTETVRSVRRQRSAN